MHVRLGRMYLVVGHCGARKPAVNDVVRRRRLGGWRPLIDPNSCAQRRLRHKLVTSLATEQSQNGARTTCGLTGNTLCTALSRRRSGRLRSNPSTPRTGPDRRPKDCRQTRTASVTPTGCTLPPVSLAAAAGGLLWLQPKQHVADKVLLSAHLEAMSDRASRDRKGTGRVVRQKMGVSQVLFSQVTNRGC
jgi:hypothetical protein